MIWAGIDPGKAGGIAVFSDAGGKAEVIRTYTIPYIGAEPDPITLADIFQGNGVEMLAIEKAQAMNRHRRQGIVSTANFVAAQRSIKTVALTLGIAVYEVYPQSWKARVLKGTAKDKAAAIAFVRNAYPGVNLIVGNKRVPHDGIADAICIGVYGYREFREQGGGDE